MSSTSPGMSISFCGENSCSISSIGKIGSRSCGVSGARVCGWIGGSSGLGRDGSTFTQTVGTWLSASRNLECSDMGKAHCSPDPPPSCYTRLRTGGCCRTPASTPRFMSIPANSPVRLKDIARDLNVSVMTVSKVVRGCADVGAETRRKVLARIKELNYQPNWVARSLAARRTFIIGLIVPDLMHSFFAEIAKGVSAAIRPLGYDVVICNSEEDGAFEASEVDRLLARQVDGLLIASAQPPHATDLFERIEARGVPYVLIDRRFASWNAPYVGADDEA